MSVLSRYGVSPRRLRAVAMATLSILAFAVPACDYMEPGGYDDYIGPRLRKMEAATQPGTQPAAQSISYPGIEPASQPSPATMPSVSSTLPAAGPLELTMQQAMLLALENNKSLAVERLNPSIQQTNEQFERGAFDPILTAGYQGSRDRVSHAPSGNGAVNNTNGNIGGNIFLPTGTDVSVIGQTNRLWTDDAGNLQTTRAGMSVTQALLRGAGVDVNLVRLRQARIDTLRSEYELRGFAQDLVANVETTYWKYALAARQIEIFTDSLALAQQQLDETKERIRIGKLAPTELAAAEAEVALRREELINARSALAALRLQMLQLLSPSGDLWNRQIVNRNLPTISKVEEDDVESHAQLAMRLRPDINQARLQIQRGDLDVVRTKNGLLPKLDLFMTLGKSGYAHSFGDSVEKVGGRGYDAQAGVTLELPPVNRQANAEYRQAVLTRTQLMDSLSNLEQLAQFDVRTAHVEMLRAGQQIFATTASRKLQEEKLRAENEKYRVGKSTSLLVAAAQRDLLNSQINEVQAIVAYLNAIIELHRQDGSLLEMQGIDAPGWQTVKLDRPAWKKQ